MGVGDGPGLPGTAGAGLWGAGREGTPGGPGADRELPADRPEDRAGLGDGGLKSVLKNQALEHGGR